MSKNTRAVKSGAEYDVVVRYWRRCLCFTKRAGVCKGIKQQMNRRYRREAKLNLNPEQ